ncbi:MAG: hypothetical protein Q8O42_12195 [Acidobacteriota bacterium]|nr:hypothetical protein [Acidobacteriota bacterium]
MDITFEHACNLVGSALRGSARQEIVADAARAANLGKALLRLRDSMRANEFKAGAHQIFLDRMIRTYDGRTRSEGFHVLHDWDGVSQQVNPDIIPIDVLHFLVEQRGGEPATGIELAILLDYYFAHVLQLLTLRVWDDGDPDRNLDLVGELLTELQGPNGSGQQFAADAETLLLIGTSHYELNESGFVTLLAKTRTLNEAHQVRIALGHAAAMGCHLRFGFEAQCGRDTVALRDDNIADYPWLCFALAGVMKEYDRQVTEGPANHLRQGSGGHEAGHHMTDEAGRDIAILEEALLNGLTPDARAFVGVPPASLNDSQDDRAQFHALFTKHKPALLAAFERHRPTETAYSPLSFFFNFSHNVVKGTVVDALLWGEAWDLTLNDLLTGVPRVGVEEGSQQLLATTLMGYARSNPDRIRGRLMPVIVYDPLAGRRAFTVALEKLSQP